MDLNSSNLAWNRSFSAPDISKNGPLYRRVVIEEQYFSHNQNSNTISYHSAVLSPGPQGRFPPLPIGSTNFPTRHFSCDQLSLISGDKLDETFNSTCTTLPITAAKTHTSTPIRNDLLPIMPPDSPMDVDHDSINKTVLKTERDLDDSPVHAKDKESKKPTILDFVDLTFQGTTPVLRKRVSSNTDMAHKKKESQKDEKLKVAKTTRYFSKTNIAIFLIAVLSVPIYDKLNYVRDIDLDNFKNELTTSLVGQTQAINALAQALHDFKNGSGQLEKHLVTFIGQTGVGKTHCVNVIKRKFMPNQIVEINLDTFEMSSYKDYLNLYKSVPYLVIFDDLGHKHMTKFGDVLSALPDNKWILVVAVFNVQETEDYKTFTVNNDLYDIIPAELSKATSTLDLITHTVKFDSFDFDFVTKHLKSFAHVYYDFVGDVPRWEEFLGQHDFKTFGFKGLFEKMNILKVKN